MAANTSNMRHDLYLPPEVWSITLNNLRDRKSQSDLTYLWTTVRHVSTHCKEQIEKIFMEEHLPKTWLHFEYSEPMTGVKESSLRLHLDHFDELDSGRAVFGQADLSTTFSFGHWCRKGQSEAKEADQKAAFRGMRDLATVVKLGNSKGHGRYKCCFMWCPCQHLLGSAPHSLESLNMEGLFVTQVRGGMNDSAVLGFKVDQKRFEVSFEWRKILSHYFEEQRITDDKFGIVADEDLREATIVRSKRLPQWYSDMNDQDPLGFELDRDVANQQSIESIVKEDKDKEFQLDHELRELLDRRRLWENPASTWRSEMQYVTGKARLTAEKAKLKRDADLEINLNDEGVVKDEQ